MVLNNSGTDRIYGCLSTSFIRLERETRRRGAIYRVLRFKYAYPDRLFVFLTSSRCWIIIPATTLQTQDVKDIKNTR
jgi:hypothetical protein